MIRSSGKACIFAAGVILSNLKLSGEEITLRGEGWSVATGRRKFGALLGDQVEVGCQAVLNPGTVIGRRSLVYPSVVWRGYLPADCIAKSADRDRSAPSVKAETRRQAIGPRL